MPLAEHNNGYFEIAREKANIGFEHFRRQYFDPELPVIIENAGADWPAIKSWSEAYIRERLSKESSAKTASLWYWMERDTLKDDYSTPVIINGLLDSTDVFPRSEVMRIWIHSKGNVSSWHYDANLVNVFNAQVSGQKEWLLVSPQTPVDCYPFINFGIMGYGDEKTMRNKIHTRFMLNQGDLLYLPPLWFHKVVSHGDENISLNWIFTKKETSISSKALVRELERYHLQQYLSMHRFTWVRNLFEKTNANIPGYLRWKWRYPEMIKTPLKPRRFQLTRRTFNELGVLAKVIRHSNKIQPYIDGLKPVKKFK